MDEADIFPVESADVAMQAVKEGVARIQLTWDEAYTAAKRDITAARELTASLVKDGFIKYVPESMLDEALATAIAAVRK
jgi:malate dehydrogenase (oxaloacetate-decarboxylating)